jgi:mono/diheme cytochrome c family protein
MSRSSIWCVLILSLVACGAPNTDGSQVTEQDPELFAVGEPLYAANCASCHGADLRGTDRGPSHLSVVYRPAHHSDGAFLLAVKIGSTQHHWSFGFMAPVDGLTDDDVAAITAFVRENQRTEGFEPYPP